MPGSDLISPSKAAQLLSVNVRTLANWRSLSQGPAWIKIGGRIAYVRTSVMSFRVEIRAEAKRGKPRMTITIRPYPRDRTRFQVDIMLPHPATSEIIRKRLTAPQGMDEAAAKAWGERQVKDILRGLFQAQAKALIVEEAPKAEKIETKGLKSKAPTMEDLWVQYETEILTDKEKTRPRTFKTYDKLWRGTLRRLIGKIPCDQWNKEDSKKLAGKFKHLSAIYSNTAATLVSNLFALAVEEDWIEDAPKILRRKTKSKPKEPAHNEGDLDLLLRAAREMEKMNGEPLELMVLLGIDAGLRPGEVAGLRWRDVDWSANQLIIQNQRPHQMPEDEDYPVKYDLAGRISMTARLRVALEAARDRLGMGRKFIFYSSKTKRAIHTDIVWDRISRVHLRAGMPPKAGHWLRHCAASRVAHHPQASISDAQGLLRHKNMSTTDIYVSQIRGTDQSRHAAAVLDLLTEGTGNALATVGNARQITRNDMN